MAAVSEHTRVAGQLNRSTECLNGPLFLPGRSVVDHQCKFRFRYTLYAVAAQPASLGISAHECTISVFTKQRELLFSVASMLRRSYHIYARQVFTKTPKLLNYLSSGSWLTMSSTKVCVPTESGLHTIWNGHSPNKRILSGW
ncbi:uncharacterized protein LOC100831284 isoform X4 [Brachypodium distachyon]|uniref:Uncharacterized protein n=1 Tax=Brachypodium distachyon TaxID=15368 RepID=A0A0Q3PA80_BRADI|nr:uncharacterized protein LOC100831284 isoform X4 [Brachypodium distachyon]KQJ85926.1 hypothetical protein BRADI_4g02485v3 [Brachypodium distachyon]KQJ85927.1 hypothetical protein BRADI_4g02485v3 [Brachypodium distachyon]KQJ85929.1 hypothetical protein BRADI_4g02485v3 [Brachypodium distachyon]PNT62373.1 hypothetical protein BRADI_4g02485v3 [Brachypodium distachyon]PNT62374.1 hypothetical protein BRADI_4g02485v3 [Brachypodium distachyon]|eukprot:XP_014758049.1 uncharacterized protein LOC100831284 isoform X4 [Brachypodium distachyon]